jgi:hypothetical protein
MIIFDKYTTLYHIMDHELNKLDECIFDYLACNADRQVSLPTIFNDIRRQTGQRCEQLTDSYRHRQYFLSTCYSLNRNYKNIRKLFRRGKLYLMFQKDKLDQDVNMKDYDYNESIYDHHYWKDDYTLEKLIDYMCEDSIFDDFEDLYFSKIFDEYDTIVHLLVRYNKLETLENLIKFHNVNINCQNAKGETPLDVAIRMKNKEMVKLLIKYNGQHDDSLEEFLNEYDRGRTMTRKVQTVNNAKRTNTFANDRDRFVTIANHRRSYEPDYQRYTRYTLYGLQGLFVIYILYKVFLLYQYLMSFF